MAYVANSRASSGLTLDAVWRQLTAFARRSMAAIINRQELRAKQFLERHQRDGMSW